MGYEREAFPLGYCVTSPPLHDTCYPSAPYRGTFSVAVWLALFVCFWYHVWLPMVWLVFGLMGGFGDKGCWWAVVKMLRCVQDEYFSVVRQKWCERGPFPVVYILGVVSSSPEGWYPVGHSSGG